MKAWRFVKAFGLENLECVELPDPQPGRDRPWSGCAPVR